MRIEDINLLDRDVFAKGVPHAVLHLPARAPSHLPSPRTPRAGLRRVVSKHADVLAISRHSVTYPSDQDRGGVAPLEEPESANAGPRAKVLIAMDPPEHTRYRKLVNRGFTPRMINALEPRIRELAARILDRAIAKGSCDFVVDVAVSGPQLCVANFDDCMRTRGWILPKGR